MTDNKELYIKLHILQLHYINVINNKELNIVYTYWHNGKTITD